ncbi:MAG: phosphatidylethanolamine N-methyltransferase family protein [Planctomycetaceae bacterium]|nr:phosphatidylethanolamine N-methyltransferase family protein [Planctomycetaceae bacterium]
MLIDLAVHAAGLALGAAVAFIPEQDAPALAYFAAARLSYVIYVSIGLRAQSQRLGLESRETAEARHAAFHCRVLRLQNIDGIAFAALCVGTRSTFPWSGWEWAYMLAGAVLIVAGVVTKAWAVRCLGFDSYTWHDFFVPKERFVPCKSGPYRFLADPMYTVGYLHTYGIALACGSWYGLAGAIFAHASIMIVNELVEKPHFRRLCATEIKPVQTP